MAAKSVTVRLTVREAKLLREAAWSAVVRDDDDLSEWNEDRTREGARERARIRGHKSVGESAAKKMADALYEIGEL